jgi:hypothetical protein
MEMSQESPCLDILNKRKLFFLLQNWRTGRQNRSCLGAGKNVRRECRRVNMVEYYVLMYGNGKMRPVETIPGVEEGR